MAHQAPLSRQEYWSEFLCPPPGDLPSSGTEPLSHVSCISRPVLYPWGLPWWFSRWRIHLQCGRFGFSPWVGKILWRRERLPTPACWPGEFHGASERLCDVHFHFSTDGAARDALWGPGTGIKGSTRRPGPPWLCLCWLCSLTQSRPTPGEQQPATLLCPWYLPGKNTGVGCYLPEGSSWPRDWTCISCIGRWILHGFRGSWIHSGLCQSLVSAMYGCPLRDGAHLQSLFGKCTDFFCILPSLNFCSLTNSYLTPNLYTLR